LSGKGDNWLRFQVENPRESNPVLLRQLFESGLPVVTFQEMPRSLEQAYLAAVERTVEDMKDD
jgi:ABC-2 type transport system ATP-binding protein